MRRESGEERELGGRLSRSSMFAPQIIYRRTIISRTIFHYNQFFLIINKNTLPARGVIGSGLS